MNPFETLTDCPGFPVFNPMMLLHAEQKLQSYQPLRPEMTLHNTGRISNVVDKGKMTIVQFEIESKDAKGQKVLTNTMSLIIRGVGGFGFKGLPMESLPQ
jgi:hypothetical protein